MAGDQPLPSDQRRLIERRLTELDRLGTELVEIDKGLAARALGDSRVLAAIGDVKRFSSPQKLVSYFGLNPRVRQSGGNPAYHGRITKQGRAHARSMLVEAAWSIAAGPGPLRGFFLRVKQKRGQHVAAVATARKLAVLIWHMLTNEQDYSWKRPALMAWKKRELELKAGMPSRRGGNAKGPAADYSLRTVRDKERQWLEMAEAEYQKFVRAWREKAPSPRCSGAASEVRRS